MFGRGGGDPHRVAVVGAGPRDQGPVGEHGAVLERAERHRHAAPVGAADRADLLRGDQLLVGQAARQVLGVTDLVASVEQADVPIGAVTRQGVGEGIVARLLGAAGLVEAAVGHAEDGVAAVEEALHGPEAELAAAVAVEDHDQRVVAVGADAVVGREGDVDVDRQAVEGLGGAAGGGVAAFAVVVALQRAGDRSAEHVRNRGLRAGGDPKGAEHHGRDDESPHHTLHSGWLVPQHVPRSPDAVARPGQLARITANACRTGPRRARRRSDRRHRCAGSARPGRDADSRPR